MSFSSRYESQTSSAASPAKAHSRRRSYRFSPTTECTNRRAQNERFLQLLLGRFGLILLAASAIGVAAAPALVAVVAPGFLADADKFQLAVAATRITFPYVFFISLVALAAANVKHLRSLRRTRRHTGFVKPMLNHCGNIFSTEIQRRTHRFGNRRTGRRRVATCIPNPFLRREKITLRPRVFIAKNDDANAGVKQVFRLVVPAIFGVSVAQINVLVNTLLASFLVTGSISWLYYSDRLMEFPVGVFGIALGTAILPSLSRTRAAHDKTGGEFNAEFNDKFSQTLDWAARWVFVICIPATVGLIALAGPLIATIFYHGTFTENGVHMAAASLVAFAVGLSAIVLVKIFAPGFYAHKNTKTPVRIAMISMAANIVFCAILVYPLRHVGLALATSLAAF